MFSSVLRRRAQCKQLRFLFGWYFLLLLGFEGCLKLDVCLYKQAFSLCVLLQVLCTQPYGKHYEQSERNRWEVLLQLHSVNRWTARITYRYGHEMHWDVSEYKSGQMPCIHVLSLKYVITAELFLTQNISKQKTVAVKQNTWKNKNLLQSKSKVEDQDGITKGALKLQHLLNTVNLHSSSIRT